MDKPAREPRNALPRELLSVLWPALQVGGISADIDGLGISGVLFGSVAGILRSSTPTLFALASGVQWFTIGSTYWAARGILLNAKGADRFATSDLTSASIIAGGIAGCAGGLLRGRRNILPGTIVFAALGGMGQSIYNFADARHRVRSGSPTHRDAKSRWLNSKWSPVKILSDEEYEGMLQEKLLRLRAEIALIDENIVELQKLAMQKKTHLNKPGDVA